MLLEFSTSSDPLKVTASFARVAETLDPVSLTYQKHASANLYSPYNSYPLNFVVPGGLGSGCRVVTVGRGTDSTRYLDIPDNGSAGGWVARQNQGSGFGPEAAVMYRPGRIMIAGGGTGLTKSVNATIDTVWRRSASMLARKDQNMVLLPDGKKIAIGGCDGTVPVKRPQIWDPDAALGVGIWTPGSGAGALAEQAKERCYHSTAVLLPDGRVLSAGGEGFYTLGDKHYAEIYCPPYLFKNDGSSATGLRPAISGVPTSVSYRKTFTVCTPDPTRVTRVCLIRPGATTHGFDENQRHVPLTFSVAPSGPPRLFVTAPASPDSAPPGNYLLFLTGAFDAATSTHYRDLPSIAKWVRITSGADLCDQVAPGPITNFTPDLAGPTEIWCYWTGPGDDDQLVESGAPTAFDLMGGDVSVPGLAGTPGSGTVWGLTPCTWYNLTVTAWDDNQHQSVPATAGAMTTCGGGGGGGFAARPVESGEGGQTRAGAAPTGAAALAPGTGPLIAETRATAAGGWQVTVRRAGETEGIDPPDEETIVVQRRGEAGAWQTLARHRVGGSAGPWGLCALRDQGRLVFPANYQLEEIRAGLRSGAQQYALLTANHSRLGDLGTTLLPAGASLAIATGDSLSLVYQA
ncbi:galactose oxidase-like domain-containing protein, partial [Actinokineospora sp.]|uniref:galactose oxidase-like domain-containing protein n=1 Tax=Actinokineospora sp. TaxID=1872133 RepID=UPI003D6B8735